MFIVAKSQALVLVKSRVRKWWQYSLQEREGRILILENNALRTLDGQPQFSSVLHIKLGRRPHSRPLKKSVASVMCVCISACTGVESKVEKRTRKSYLKSAGLASFVMHSSFAIAKSGLKKSFESLLPGTPLNALQLWQEVGRGGIRFWMVWPLCWCWNHKKAK